MVQAELKPPLRIRPGVAALVAALHLIALFGLLRAFAPQLVSGSVGSEIAAFDVPLPVKIPQPEPSHPAKARASGVAAPAGQKAEPREVTAPTPKIRISAQPAPAVASTGAAIRVGSSAEGPGTGAGGVGDGTGSGGTGAGDGGGASKAVKLSGDIVSTRDYPRKTRDLRLGGSVTIALTVGIDGAVQSCRIVRPSRDPEADRITCALATERFRFRPARDAAGRPIASVYGWRQRWFTPGEA